MRVRLSRAAWRPAPLSSTFYYPCPVGACKEGSGQLQDGQGEQAGMREAVQQGGGVGARGIGIAVFIGEKQDGNGRGQAQQP